MVYFSETNQEKIYFVIDISLSQQQTLARFERSQCCCGRGGEGGGEVGEFRRPSVGFVVHTASLVAPNEVGPSL